MIRDITIKAVLNGFVCQVGCQTVVFESRSELVSALGTYLEKPEDVEKNWRLNALNAGHTLRETEPCCDRIMREPAPMPKTMEIGQGLRP
jgi:hypothetical protein